MSKLQVDDIVNKEDNGSVGFSRGAVVTGVITATSFSGPVSAATGDFSIADKIVHTGDTNTAIRFPAADTFTVETSGSERLRVNSSGKLGIGTVNPLRQLQLHSDAAETVALQLTNQGTGATNDNSGFTLKIGSVGQVNLDQRTPGQDIIVFTNGVERMRYGSVGVCTFVKDLHISNGNFSFTASDARAINALQTLKVNINSNGGVSNRVFEVLDNSSSLFTVGTAGLSYGYQTTDDGSSDFGINIIGSSGNLYQNVSNTSADGFVLRALGSQKVQLKGDGAINATGTIDGYGIVSKGNSGTAVNWTSYHIDGATNPITSKILANGNAEFVGSVKIGGSASANEIDEYEVGTWTPAPTFGGGNTGITGTFTGYYIRVGELVNAFWNCTFTNKGSSTGAFSLSGQPFSIQSVPRDGTSFSYIHRLNIQTVDAGDQLFGYMTGAPSMTLYVSGGTSTSNAAALTNADFANSTDLTGCTTYRIS